MMGNNSFLVALLAGKRVDEIRRLGATEREGFLRRRARYVLYE